MGPQREVPRRCWGDRGASLVEYGLLVTLIAIICIGTVTVLGHETIGFLDKAGEVPQHSPETSVGSPGGSGPGTSTSTTSPPCSTTSTVPEDVDADCATTTTASP